MKIEHDFHIHTGLSLCASEDVTAQQYLDNARKLGLKKIGFANHMWDETIKPPLNRSYKIQTIPYNLEIMDELAPLDKSGLEVFVGAEAEFHPEYGVALTEENAEKFDFIIVPNSHTHMTMDKSLYEPYSKHLDFMIEAYRKIINSKVSRYITAIAHPFDAVCCPYDNRELYKMISDDCFKELFSQTAEKNIAIEFNTSSLKDLTLQNAEYNVKLRMFKIAKSEGCKFTFGSDAHSVKGQENYNDICNTVVEILGLKSEDLAEIVR